MPLAQDRPDLFQRSNAIGLRQLIGHLALLVFTGTAVASTLRGMNYYIWPLALFAHGTVLSHLYMPFHESNHGTAFASGRLCQLIGWIFGFLIFMNADSFRWFHREHHEHTQVGGKDPELPGANGGLKPYLNKLLGGEMAVALYFFMQSATYGEDAEPPWTPDTQKSRVVASTRIQLAGYILVLAFAVANSAVRWYVVHLWLLPLLAGQPFMWGHFIAQHTATDHTTSDTDARHTARVVLTNRFYGWLCWNMNYHAVHHMDPQIPFHKQKAAFAAISKKSPFKHVEKDGYLAAHTKVLNAVL